MFTFVHHAYIPLDTCRAILPKDLRDHACAGADLRLQSGVVPDLGLQNQISQVTLTDERLFSASAPPAQDRESVVSTLQWGASAINVLDFAAPSSELADAECPFSSNYDDIAGYRANDLLATPYDNVNPDRFG